MSIRNFKKITVEAICTSTYDTLITIMTASFPFINCNRYTAQYKYEYEGKRYFKYINFKKKKVDGILTWCHPLEIELTFNPKKPEKAKWNNKKII